MAIRDVNNYGKRISEELANYLRKYTKKTDWSSVSEDFPGVSFSTIRDVIYRTNSLTENNSKAIQELMRKAIQNCMKSKEGADTALEYLVNELEVESEEVK